MCFGRCHARNKGLAWQQQHPLLNTSARSESCQPQHLTDSKVYVPLARTNNHAFIRHFAVPACPRRNGRRCGRRAGHDGENSCTGMHGHLVDWLGGLFRPPSRDCRCSFRPRILGVVVLVLIICDVSRPAASHGASAGWRPADGRLQGEGVGLWQEFYAQYLRRRGGSGAGRGGRQREDVAECQRVLHDRGRGCCLDRVCDVDTQLTHPSDAKDSNLEGI